MVWIPPGLRHWHGATATTGMSHIALQEHVDGRVAEWMEKVSDEQTPVSRGASWTGGRYASRHRGGALPSQGPSSVSCSPERHSLQGKLALVLPLIRARVP